MTEVEPVYPMRFEELGVPDKEIESLLRGKDPLYVSAKLPATKPLIDRYTNWIQEFLASKGITEKIAGKVMQPAAEQFAIVFRPARNLPAVAQVTFQGNQVVPQGVLREAVHGTAIGSPYTESGFRELLNNTVRPVYEQRGRVRVAFPEVRAEPASDVEGVHVFVKVDEGQSYELGKVAIAGPSSGGRRRADQGRRFQDRRRGQFRPRERRAGEDSQGRAARRIPGREGDIGTQHR